MRRAVAIVVLLWLGLTSTAAGIDADEPGSQLTKVRGRIRQLEGELGQLSHQADDIEKERDRLNAELELAQARVDELELVLAASRDEASRLRAEVEELGDQLAARREVLGHHLEMMVLLGRPGPLQLLLDAAAGGDVDRAVSTVSVLTTGQVRLMEEYRAMRRERGRRLADLSRVLEVAEREAAQLEQGRTRLKRTRSRVDARLRELRRTQRAATAELAELRDREVALEHLLGLLSTRDRIPDAEDIHKLRGALPWPASGEIVRTFGKHYLPKYATYTVCNGLRLDVQPGSPVRALFAGEVAYAREFKGYGNMVVLDHGHEVYSLVAGLESIAVRLNQRVGISERLGTAGAPDADGNLYVEIRVGKKPQDPRRWLQLEEE